MKDGKWRDKKETRANAKKLWESGEASSFFRLDYGNTEEWQSLEALHAYLSKPLYSLLSDKPKDS